MVRDCQSPAGRIANTAETDEFEASLLSHSIGRHEVDRIFHGASVDSILGQLFRPRRPVRRQNDEIRAIQSQGTRRLRKPGVVTDQHSNSETIHFNHFKRTIARSGETIDTQPRQMNLAIRPGDPLGANQNGSVEDIVSD